MFPTNFDSAQLFQARLVVQGALVGPLVHALNNALNVALLRAESMEALPSVEAGDVAAFASAARRGVRLSDRFSVQWRSRERNSVEGSLRQWIEASFVALTELFGGVIELRLAMENDRPCTMDQGLAGECLAALVWICYANGARDLELRAESGGVRLIVGKSDRLPSEDATEAGVVFAALQTIAAAAGLAVQQNDQGYQLLIP